MLRRGSSGAILAFAILSSCSTRSTAPAPAEGSQLLARLARMPAFSERLRGRASPSELQVELPAALTAPVRMVPREAPSAWLEMAATDVRAVSSALEDGARVHVDALPSTDVVQIALPSGFEEIRWLKDERAPKEARYALHVGEGATLRLREGHVEVVDAHGRVSLASAPMFAVDADGVQRAVAATLDTVDGVATLVTTLDASGLRYPIAVDPLFGTAAPLGTARTGCRPIALSGGKAMVVGCGGFSSSAAGVKTAEIYDLATNTWSAAAPMSVGRVSAASVYLAALNKVLVVGGTDAGTALSSVEVYDVATNTWANGTAMSTARGFPMLAPIAGGARALVVDQTTKSEVYDPVAKTWTVTGAMPIAHPVYATITSLPDGRVAVTGGGVYPSANPTNLSLFTPSGAGGTWGSGAPIAQGRGQAGAAVVGGKLLIAGGAHLVTIPSGFTYAGTQDAELWNPATNSWSTLPPLAKSGGTFVAALSSGRGYIFEAANLEVLDPTALTFAAGGASTASLAGVTLSTNKDVLLLSSDGLANQLYRLSSGGVSCTTGLECATGFCTGGACCGTATCPSGFVCNAPKKPGTCVKVDGASCAAAADCDSGFCVDGVCCGSACTGQCQACNVAGKEGTCAPVLGAPHGTRTACAGGSDPDTCKRLACDGVDTAACHFPGGAVTCGAATCTALVETHVSTCNGSGACADTPKSCGSYTCGPTACRTTCGVPSDCTAGFRCDMTTALCVPLTGLGAKCDATSPCSAGLFCADGVCCGKPSCGAGSTCAAPGKEGTCSKSNGSACLTEAECGTGLCVDGVCCDTKCDGQCEACNVKGAVGTCSPVTGDPRGGRMACAKGSDACSAAQCDGVERTSCKGFVGSTVECRAASCEGGMLTARAVCSGGSCPAAAPTPCDGFACDGDACKTACASSADCVDGYTCIGAKCTKKTSICSPDGDSVVASDGTSSSCAPYRCKAGSCVSACAGSDDCAAGTLCQTDTKKCEPVPEGDAGGGCSVAVPGESSGLGLLAALAALGVIAVRRRQGSCS